MKFTSRLIASLTLPLLRYLSSSLIVLLILPLPSFNIGLKGLSQNGLPWLILVHSILHLVFFSPTLPPHINFIAFCLLCHLISVQCKQNFSVFSTFCLSCYCSPYQPGVIIQTYFLFILFLFSTFLIHWEQKPFQLFHTPLCLMLAYSITPEKVLIRLHFAFRQPF